MAHPPFNPCLSACAKYGTAAFCCTGKHDSASRCGPNYYSKRAKLVCPDAYSYAYDDAKSIFTAPTGSSFEVVFCPNGRSTRILQSQAEPDVKTSAAAVFGRPDARGFAGALLLVAVGVGALG